MSFPVSVGVEYQIIDFTIPKVVTMKMFAENGFFFVYPLTKVYPSKKYKFFDKFNENWKTEIKETNKKVTKSFLKDWDNIEISSINNIVQGAVLYHGSVRYFLPFVPFVIGDFPNSRIKLSLNFEDNSSLREFENDKLTVVKLLDRLTRLNRQDKNWECVVDKNRLEDFSDPYVIFVHDEDTKKRLEYLKNVKYYADVNTKILTEKQINEFCLYSSKKTTELENVDKINTYIITDKEHQLITVDSNVYILKRHSTEKDARDWLDNTRLYAIRNTSYHRNDIPSYPNNKFQFFVEVYETLSNYLNELLEDVDGYKISIVKHSKTFYIFIPVFIEYKKRIIENTNTPENYVEIWNNDSYLTLDTLVVDSVDLNFPSVRQIASMVKTTKSIFVLTRNGDVFVKTDAEFTFVRDLKDVIKIAGNDYYAYCLTVDKTLYRIADRSPDVVTDNVDNVWAFDDALVYISNKNVTCSNHKIFKYRDWKTILPNYGLTYRGIVFELETDEEIKFRKKIIQISKNGNKLFAWNKSSYFVYSITKKKFTEITKSVCQIVKENLILTIEKKNEKR